MPTGGTDTTLIKGETPITVIDKTANTTSNTTLPLVFCRVDTDVHEENQDFSKVRDCDSTSEELPEEHVKDPLSQQAIPQLGNTKSGYEIDLNGLGAGKASTYSDVGVLEPPILNEPNLFNFQYAL